MKPLRPFEFARDLSPREVLEQMEGASFGARSLARAWRVLKILLDDRECGVVLTVSGALSVAQLSSCFQQLIALHRVHAVVTTGAVVTHQLVQELGLTQCRVPSGATDASLVQRRLNRIYDSVEPESNLDALERFVAGVAEGWEGRLGSSEITRRLGSRLAPGSGWLAEAASLGVPVFVPALTDSELGLVLHRYGESPDGRRFHFDAMADLDAYAEWMRRRRSIGLITLGGGVPRNWAMQMLPYLKSRLESPLPRVVGGIRICPDNVAYGHLSGSTYSEAITWGKLEPEDLPNFAEVLADATIVFPFLTVAALEWIRGGASGGLR